MAATTITNSTATEPPRARSADVDRVLDGDDPCAAPFRGAGEGERRDRSDRHQQQGSDDHPDPEPRGAQLADLRPGQPDHDGASGPGGGGGGIAGEVAVSSVRTVRQREERFLERHPSRTELVQHGSGRQGDLADALDGERTDGEQAVGHLDRGACLPQDLRETRRVRRARENDPASGAGQHRHRPLRDEPPAVDHHDAIGHLGDLGQDVAGDQHRAIGGSEVPEETAEPRHAGRIEPVRRLIEDQHRWVPEEGGGEGEALPHARREPAHAPVRVVGHAGRREHLGDPGDVDVGLERHDREVVARRPPRMEARDLERCADPGQGPIEMFVRRSEDAGGACGGSGETEQHTHGGRLARPVGSEEPGHRAAWNGEGQSIHGDDVPEPLRECIDLDRGRVHRHAIERSDPRPASPPRSGSARQRRRPRFDPV